MLDLHAQPSLSEMFALADVPNRIPKGRNGKKRHLSRIHEWRSRGIRGVKLQAIRVGGAWCTCDLWLTEFFQRLSDPTIKTAANTPARIVRAHREAEQMLEACGI
jgi:hypothetical protein